ncbi:uncharacterized protein LOC131997288 [Stomoxys calcitrans]|uniref:uncharacterized protein LOC131997288 n=1 Tax=Stomoxys calcitrans TaxID=35570 RepID=UPI0027E38D9C|nr:uncharacterized protein LOC131997288 [Stomoxys calcitrans]
MAAEKHNFWYLCLIAATFAMVFSLVSHDAEAYQMVIPAGEDGNCTYRGDKLEPGQQPGPVPCQRLTCNDDGTVLVEGCGKLRIENCNHGERVNPEKPFPECCKLVYKCKNSDGSSYYIERNAQESSAAKSENST